jgi:hypothetical protein
VFSCALVCASSRLLVGADSRDPYSKAVFVNLRKCLLINIIFASTCVCGFRLERFKCHFGIM